VEVALAVPAIIVFSAAALAVLVIFRFPDLTRLSLWLGFFSLEVWRPGQATKPGITPQARVGVRRKAR
jgi:hypothetical protein